jgi:hypothetical protein
MFSPLRRSDPDFFEFEWFKVLVAPRYGDYLYTQGQIVRPPAGIGLYAECTTAGLSGAAEPAWPTTAGGTVTDGTVIWTMKTPAQVTLPTITAATYTVTPAGITQSGAAITGTRTKVKLDATNANLGSYRVVAEITAGGEDYSISEHIAVVD